jgi:hypothetical protein
MSKFDPESSLAQDDTARDAELHSLPPLVNDERRKRDVIAFEVLGH